jgi:hypothetical protein
VEQAPIVWVICSWEQKRRVPIDWTNLDGQSWLNTKFKRSVFRMWSVKY